MEKGLYKYTSQEALNKHLGNVITVTPTISTSTVEYSPGDALISNVEIPNAVPFPGGTSVLMQVGFWNRTPDTAGLAEHNILFHQKSGADLGTANQATDIDASEFSNLGFLGAVRLETSAQETSMDNVTFGMFQDFFFSKYFLLQAEPDSTSVYFSIDLTGNPILSGGGNDLTWIFHIEYKR